MARSEGSRAGKPRARVPTQPVRPAASHGLQVEQDRFSKILNPTLRSEAQRLGLNAQTAGFLDALCEQMKAADPTRVPGGSSAQELRDINRVVDLARSATRTISDLAAARVRLADKYETVSAVSWLFRDQLIPFETITDETFLPSRELGRMLDLLRQIEQLGAGEVKDRAGRGKAGGAPRNSLPRIFIAYIAQSLMSDGIKPSAADRSRFMAVCRACFADAGFPSPLGYVRAFLRETRPLQRDDGACL